MSVCNDNNQSKTERQPESRKGHGREERERTWRDLKEEKGMKESDILRDKIN